MEPTTERDVLLTVDDGRVELQGTLIGPPRPEALIIFAHGSGSSRLSPRNRRVAANLAGAGFATVLFDLLTVAEAENRRNVFDIALLARRVADAVRWARHQPMLQDLGIGLFGSSTGAAAALAAATDLPGEIGAIVSRGGRPDLAGPLLPEVDVPTLLIVGGEDRDVIKLNRDALKALACDARIEIVPGATHLFEEAGTLEEVERLAAAWFRRWLCDAGRGP